ncbi:chromate efflux transporter [Bauldia sp.]|uniref:chromate efflux transporter n=1 Tax=Bauldia sp. TaxID=2575872 RepID=UPI003BA8B554
MNDTIATAPQEPKLHTPSFAEATKVWATIGLLSFGGPAGQIGLMHRILVDERKWVSEPRFLHALNFCMLLPGPEAQQLATYIGWLLHGVRGGLVAGLFFILPGLVVILALSTAYALFQDTSWLASLFFGLKAAVLAIVIDAVIRIGRRALKGTLAIALATAAFAAIFVFQVPFPLIVLVAAIVGFWTAGRQAETKDEERTPSEPTPSRRRIVLPLATWLPLWFAPVAIAGLILGPDSVFVELGLFFSWLAVVTFGGAYAVLAYVADAAVTSFGWLNPGQMLDGLAMAETTPGPLILVLTFVGFLAAYQGAADAPIAAGLVGGLLTTWVTFAPCFLWIFLGAPYIERLRGNARLAGALSAVTAAVVGVILNLALWFGLHVVFADVETLDLGLAHPAWPVWATVDGWAIALMAAALIALFALRLGVIATLGICAALGVAVQTLT